MAETQVCISNALNQAICNYSEIFRNVTSKYQIKTIQKVQEVSIEKFAQNLVHQVLNALLKAYYWICYCLDYLLEALQKAVQIPLKTQASNTTMQLSKPPEIKMPQNTEIQEAVIETPQTTISLPKQYVLTMSQNGKGIISKNGKIIFRSNDPTVCNSVFDSLTKKNENMVNIADYTPKSVGGIFTNKLSPESINQILNPTLNQEEQAIVTGLKSLENATRIKEISSEEYFEVNKN